jgi:hypothetical protein
MLSGGSIDRDRYKKEGDKFRVSFVLGGVVRIVEQRDQVVLSRFVSSINSILDIGFFVTEQL